MATSSHQPKPPILCSIRLACQPQPQKLSPKAQARLDTARHRHPTSDRPCAESNTARHHVTPIPHCIPPWVPHENYSSCSSRFIASHRYKQQ